MPQYYFPAPVAEEFTGHPHCTDLVVINKLLEEDRNTWEAWNAGARPVQARLITTTAFLPEIDRRAVLTAWAQAYDRADHTQTPPAGVPAWVFVHINTLGEREDATYYYAACRPSAGEAFAHVLRYASYGRPQDWDWLFRDLEDGEEVKRGERPLTPEIARLPLRDLANEGRTELPDGSCMNVVASWPNGYRVLEKPTGNERYEWPDGSAITVQGLNAWDFGFHRDRLADQAVIEACADDVDPMFAWPAEVAVAGEPT